MANNWVKQQESEYLDFDNENFGEEFSRVTFCYEGRTAYATKANSDATADNDEYPHTDETVNLTWEQAEAIVGESVVVSAPQHG